MDWSACEAITFDCYGTLVDWETGILGALRPLLAVHGVELSDDEVLRRFARFEAEVEAGPFLSYRQVLAEVTRRLAAEVGVELRPGQETVLATSLSRWPLFSDTREALVRLASRYRLGILSNVDDDLFADTRRALGVDFDWVVTAQQVGSYKPARANFEVLLARVDVPPERLVHAAQSLYHDVAPARKAGLATVWVDRRAGRSGGGATPAADAVPDLRVTSLQELAEAAAGP